MGGELLCRFKPKKESDKDTIKSMGISELKKIFTVEDLAKGDRLTFTATGIIDGPLLPGIVFEKDKIITHSLVIRARSKTFRYITTHHHVHPIKT